MLSPPRLYVYLEAVARAGSIRKAAERLNVASTALNRMVLDAERDIGTPLFERLPRGVRLTAAGEVLIATIRRSLSDLSAAGSQIEQLRGLVRGSVRIACSEAVAYDLIPILIGQYQQKHPGVHFSIDGGATPKLFAALMADDVDLMLAHDPPLSPMLNEICANEHVLCAMMRPDHPLAERKSIRLADCQPYPVALGASGFRSRVLIDECLARTRLSLKVVLEAGSIQSLKMFVMETGALSFQFRIGVAAEERKGLLVSVPLVDKGLPRGRLVLASRRGRTLPIASLSFIEMIKSSLERLPF